MENYDGINVFLIGAGASVSAGIPVLRKFIEAMYFLEARGGSEGKKIGKEELYVLSEALKIRNNLGRFHRGALFDDWNIEDILSLLNFENMISGKSVRKDIDKMTEAISLTIELSNQIHFSGKYDNRRHEGGQYHRRFWNALVPIIKNSGIIPIITFNYDLSFERALFMNLVGTVYNSAQQFGYNQVRIDYGFSNRQCPCFSVKNTRWNTADYFDRTEEGISLTPVSKDNLSYSETILTIELLKLHGSINFPSNAKTSIVPFNPVTNPLILPPIFSKTTSPVASVWARALSRLRSARRVIIIGYSMPQTDVYMSYFLKSALGPNERLERVIVIDPCLSNNTAEADAMRHRYLNCFAQQLENRLEFNPSSVPDGKFETFIKALELNPYSLLFQI